MNKVERDVAVELREETQEELERRLEKAVVKGFGFVMTTVIWGAIWLVGTLLIASWPMSDALLGGGGWWEVTVLMAIAGTPVAMLLIPEARKAFREVWEEQEKEMDAES